MEKSARIIEDLLAGMTLENKFWGYLFSRVRKEPMPKLSAPMAVGFDNYDMSLKLFYKPDVVENTDAKVLTLILEHEGVHLLNKHPSRIMRLLALEKIKLKESEEKKFLNVNVFKDICNLAADCAVNCQMHMPKVLQVNGNDFIPVFPDQFELLSDQIFEYYLREILKKVKDTEGGDGEGLFYQLCEGNGSEIPQHEWLNENGEFDPDTAASKMDMVTYKLVKETVKAFSQRGRGNMSGYLRELIENLLMPPTLPYYQMIAKLVKGTRLSKYKRSPTTLNRKRLYTFIDGMPTILPFPGKKRDKTFHVGLGVDVSGSRTTKEIVDNDLTAVRDLIENDPYCRVTLIQIDTEIKEKKDIKKLSEIKQFEIKGRGGTTLYPALKEFKNLGVDVVLFFTDGFCDIMKKYQRNTMPNKIIWCLPDGGSKNALEGVGTIVDIPKSKR